MTESDYVHTIGETKYYFSSDWNRKRFIQAYTDEVKRFNQSLNNIYKHKFELQGDSLAMVRLYMQIEKRGFYIIMNGVELTCLENLVFVVTPTYKESLEELTNLSKTNNPE